MKTLLMFRDHDFDLEATTPPNAQALTQDLELDTLCDGMALGDDFLLAVARQAVLCSVQDPDVIRYRQRILQDCLKNPLVVRRIYDLAVETIEAERKNYWPIMRVYPDSILRRSVDVMQMLVAMLRKLRAVADEHAAAFDSEGFTALFAMLRAELSDAFFAEAQRHLAILHFRHGVLISATLEAGAKGGAYALRKPHDAQHGWLEHAFGKKLPAYTFCLGERDESGAMALAELRARGINLVANALAQSADHVLGFFTTLRTELAFYVGALNLHERLTRKGEPVSFPVPVAAAERKHAFRGLYDVCLALRLEQRVIGNDVTADGKNLVVVTGANQGGKSTFLRAIGVAQLMLQCGLFAPAESFCANICAGLFTHYKREEDTTMESGKLDEELGRMNGIVERLTRNSMVLLNESFAATNEREGSEIARQIVTALLAGGVKVFFVTHLYEFGRSYFEQGRADAMFLRAERGADGRRTFRLTEGQPLETSYGEDLYYQIFATDQAGPLAAAAARNLIA